MIVVFDLDDTLYEEITYVRSGFRAVANYLSDTYKFTAPDEIYYQLLHLLDRDGRGKVFDSYLSQHNLSSSTVIKKCLSVYRSHSPDIHLSESGNGCLQRLKSCSKFLVTDGNKVVQTRKINSLGIRPFFKRTLVTHNYGLKHSKPSTYCFHKILSWENRKPQDLVYIGDNPTKDFVNLKKEGFKTVRVLTGEHRGREVSIEYEADYQIESLDELSIQSLKQMMGH